MVALGSNLAAADTVIIFDAGPVALGSNHAAVALGLNLAAADTLITFDSD